METIDRRRFLQRSTVIAGAAIIAPSLVGLTACSEPVAPYDANGVRRGLGRTGVGGYGVLRPAPRAPEISVPEGFDAIKIGEAGEMMSDGNQTPVAHDGMAAYGMPNGSVRLVRNHEVRNTANDPNCYVISDVRPYDRLAPAGTTTLELRLHADGEPLLVRDFVSLSGTFVNCAGGETPWGSWVTSEETVAGRSAGWAENHGYNFEVPASANDPVPPIALREMGRFAHEAIAVDSTTWLVYETEDRNPGGFYLFVPHVRGNLAAGGTLYILAVKERPRFDTRRGQRVGQIFETEWIEIYHPDSDNPNLPDGFVFNQGLSRGAAQFGRLEGAWWGDGGVYFVSTSGGDAGAGQVWKFTPTGGGTGELALVFESPAFSVLNSPDNIVVTPRAGILLCEDGTGTNYVRGVTSQGQVFDFARNDANDFEWAGACFSPQGRTLFVNIQGSTQYPAPANQKGATYGIWGPWEEGVL